MSSSHPPSSIPRPSYICLHCGTTETPLWRAGPAGPKTLCNACGVRWKKTGSLLARPKRPPPPPPSSSNAPPKRARAPPSPPRVQLVVPTPKPVSVFRLADASKGRYESVFSGLMRVARGGEGGRRRADVREKDEGDGPSDSPGQVWVTEMLAPSPSPSPPPIPRVQRGGGGMILVVAGKDKNWTPRGKDDDLGRVIPKPANHVNKVVPKQSDDINKLEAKQFDRILKEEPMQPNEINKREQKHDKGESENTQQPEVEIRVVEKKIGSKSIADNKESVDGESNPQ